MFTGPAPLTAGEHTQLHIFGNGGPNWEWPKWCSINFNQLYQTSQRFSWPILYNLAFGSDEFYTTEKAEFSTAMVGQNPFVIKVSLPWSELGTAQPPASFHYSWINIIVNWIMYYLENIYHIFNGTTFSAFREINFPVVNFTFIIICLNNWIYTWYQ